MPKCWAIYAKHFTNEKTVPEIVRLKIKNLYFNLLLTFNLVPTPSVPETSKGSLYPALFVSNSPPKPPIFPTTPNLLVVLASGLI